MWRIGWMLCVLLLSSEVVMGAEVGRYYVDATALNQRSRPVDGSIIRKLYRNEVVDVIEFRGEWARIANGDDTGWVNTKYLSRTRAQEVEQPDVSAYADPRIAEFAIPKAGDLGHTKEDVVTLWMGAKKMLDNGRCKRIELAAKSTNQSGKYYVNCGDPQHIYFTRASL